MAARGRDPLLTLLFVCDQMIRDDIAKKWGALGMFNTLFCEDFPMTFHSFWWFARVADAPDVIDLVTSLVAPSGLVVSSKKAHFDKTETAEASSLSKWWEIGGRFDMPTFSVPGVYRVELAINGVTLGDSALHAVQTPRRG